MKTLRWTRLASIALAAAMPLGVLAPACSTSSSPDNTSTIGQRISCHDDGTTISGCHADDGAAGSGSDSCEDIDDDGDGSPHDDGEEHHQHTGSAAGSAGSDDQGHDAVDDDDGDGIPNERDCDRRHGGDDDPADHDAGDDSGSGSGSGSGSDGAGHT
ncbi:MAG TPA: hypothetical protein VFP84_22970 [Kofleriaceae bacterium]|nr:hypothetical protein [Kofleriaceae bacterium]